MKNLKKIIVFVLALMFLTSSMIFTSSAAFLSGSNSNGGYRVTWNQNCTNGQSQNSNCPTGFGGASFGQYSYNCPTSGSTTGGIRNTDPASGNCTWSNQSIESFLNAAQQAAGNTAAAEQQKQPADSNTTDSAGTDTDTYTAADKTTNSAAAGQDAVAAAETPESDAAAPASCVISSVETMIGNCKTVSDTGTAAPDTLVRYLNSILSKCGINLGSFGNSGAAETPVTDTPSQEPSAPAESSAPETSAPVDTGSSDTNTNTDVGNLSFEEQVAALVNEQRAANGLSPLTLNAKLSNAARAKSQDMHDNHYFSHTSPTYGSPFAMLTSFGISYSSAGENIAMGYATPAAVMEAWMNSAGHRANILNASYTQIGVGYVADGNYWTQEFIG